MANSRDIDRAVSAMAARTVTGSIYEARMPKKAPRKRKPAKVAGDQAAAQAAMDRFFPNPKGAK